MEFSEIVAFAFVASLLVISPGPNGVLMVVSLSLRSVHFDFVIEL